MATGFLPVQAEVSGHYKEICSKKRVFCFGSESDCCTYTSPTWRENARFAPAEIDQHLPITLPVAVSHCRTIAESPGLFALVFGPRSAAEFGDTAHILLYLFYPGGG